jgi:hypothetical protein
LLVYLFSKLRYFQPSSAKITENYIFSPLTKNTIFNFSRQTRLALLSSFENSTKKKKVLLEDSRVLSYLGPPEYVGKGQNGIKSTPVVFNKVSYNLILLNNQLIKLYRELLATLTLLLTLLQPL